MTLHRFLFLVILVLAALASAASAVYVRAEEMPSATVSTDEILRLAEPLRLKNQPWATLPWNVSLTEARRLAFTEHKPIFLVVNTGNCLGWT